MNRKNGFEAVSTIKRVIEDFPAVKPIIILLKFYLRQKNMNETFTGGISSFLLFNLVYAYLQFIVREDKSEVCENLGLFLLGFLKFYAYEFNYRELGISLREGGCFFNKENRNFPNNDNLCLENFQDPSLDIGRAAYQYQKVSGMFQDVLCQLYKLKSGCDSMLKQMITITKQIQKRSVWLVEEKWKNKENLY